MPKFLYIFKNCCRNIVSPRCIFVVSLLSMTLGLFIPCMVLSNADTLIRDYRLEWFYKPQNTLIFNTYHDKLSDDLLELAKAISGAQTIGIDAGIYNSFVNVNGMNKNVQIRAVSDNYFKSFINAQVVRGRIPTEDEIASNASLCVIERSFISDNGFIDVGEHLIVYGQDFEIVGIVELFSPKSSVIIPYTAMPNLPTGHTLYLYYDSEPADEQTVLDAMTTLFPDNKNLVKNTIKTADSLDLNKRQLMLANSFKALLISCVLLLYAAVNVVLIIAGKMRLQNHENGIKIALGATKTDIYLEIFSQNICLVLLSTILLSIIYTILGSFVPIFALRPSIITYLGVFMLGCVISSVTSLIVMVILFNKPLVSLLGGERS